MEAPLPTSSDGILAIGDKQLHYKPMNPPLILTSETKNTIGLRGMHKFTNFHPVTAHDEWLLKELGKYYDEGKQHLWLPRCQHLINDVQAYKNITVTIGRKFLAQILCNTQTQTNKYVTHFAVGSNNTAAAVGDIQLGTETFRKAVSSAVESSNVANISTFLGASEANSTWQEWGHFIDGTGSANSGTMLSHHIQTVVKASPDTKTVDSTYTFSDA